MRLPRSSAWANWILPFLAVFAGLTLLGLASVPGAESDGSTHAPAPFMRVFKPDTHTIQLQIALRQFKPAQGLGPDVWLVGAAHIGQSNYFAELQSFLDAQDLVLFEGVGLENAPNLPDAGQTEGTLQSVLAKSLDLAFQLEAIEYGRAHFRNSDLSLEELQARMMRQIEEGGLENSLESNPEFVALMAAMQGSSWMGALLHVGVKLLGSSPKLKAMTRLMLVEVLGQVEGDMSEMEGLPPDVRQLLQVLIQARNQKVITDLKASLAQAGPPGSIAIFYGAAHMADMESRIISGLAYRPATNRWLTAISVNPKEAGLSPAEINTIRRLTQWQMEALNQVRATATDKTDEAAPPGPGP